MAVDAGWDFVEVDVLVLLDRKLLVDLLFVSRLWNFLDWGLGFSLRNMESAWARY